VRSRDRGPTIAELTSDRPQEDGVTAAPGIGKRRHQDRVRNGQAPLAPPVGRLDVLEDRASGEPSELDVDTGVAEHVELLCARGLRVDADERTDVEPEAGQCERAVTHGATKAPAARVLGGDVP